MSSMRLARITNDTFFAFRGSILNRVILFERCSDLQGYFNNANEPINLNFPNAKIIFLVNCTKDFSYKTIRLPILPNIKRIYLMSDYYNDIITRLPNVYYHVSSDRYYRSKPSEIAVNNITLRNPEILKTILQHYEHESLELYANGYFNNKY